MKKEFLKTKSTTGLFSILGLIGGIIFLDPNITGNVIYDGKIQSTALSSIGLGLIFCSIILALYTIKKKN